MNYLAHLFLSPPMPQVIVGNLMGDFVKGNQFSHLPTDVQTGIKLHRAIDKFTDKHEHVIYLKDYLSDHRKRYAAIISDIVFDHFLALNWQEYSEQPIEVFAHQHYQILSNNLNLMPEKMQNMVARMIERNWLARYACITTTGLAIDAVSERIRFKNQLAGAMEEVLTHYSEYQSAFNAFFPELISFSEKTYQELRAQQSE